MRRQILLRDRSPSETSWSNGMRHGVRGLHDFTVGATDGEIGEVKDVYFDALIQSPGWARRPMPCFLRGSRPAT